VLSEVQPHLPSVIDFSYSNYIIPEFASTAWAEAAAGDGYVHIAVVSLCTNFEKLLVLECETAELSQPTKTQHTWIQCFLLLKSSLNCTLRGKSPRIVDRNV